MLKKEMEQRQAIEMLCTDMLVPQDHLLRKIDKAVDFAHIYEFVKGCYSEGNGRPSIDPVVLFKLVMIQHLFGIRSLRQTQAEAEGLCGALRDSGEHAGPDEPRADGRVRAEPRAHAGTGP